MKIAVQANIFILRKLQHPFQHRLESEQITSLHINENGMKIKRAVIELHLQRAVALLTVQMPDNGSLEAYLE